MTKQKTLTIAILISVVFVLIATVFALKLGDSKKDETISESPSSLLSEEENKIVAMSEEIARSIAENSECVNDGPLKENVFYNENSKTWWIDLDIDKPGCSPACVVYEDETVKINWRCTGLIQ